MTISAETRAVLENRSAPLAQVVKVVSAAERELANAADGVIGVSSSVTIDLLGLFLRREGALSGLRARIVQGGYDDPIGDMERFAAEGVERVVIAEFGLEERNRIIAHHRGDRAEDDRAERTAVAGRRGHRDETGHDP